MAIDYATGEIIDADDDASEYHYEESPAARALATVDATPAPVALQHSRAEIEALKDTIKAANAGMTDAQFIVFMAAARHLGLDPLARQVVPIFQNGKMTVQTTIDGFRLIAERSRKYRGQIGPFWCGPDGEWKDVWLADGAPTAAKVGIKRSDFDEVMWGVARFKSYYRDNSPTWKALPDVMLAKVAEALALRKTFPDDLSGAYTAEELAFVDADPAPTIAAPTAPAASQRPARQTPTKPAPAKPSPTPAPATPTDERVTQALSSRTILGLLRDLEITDSQQQREKLAKILEDLDKKNGHKATGRELMDALETAITDKADKAAAAAANGSTPHESHELSEAFTGPMPN